MMGINLLPKDKNKESRQEALMYSLYAHSLMGDGTPDRFIGIYVDGAFEKRWSMEDVTNLEKKSLIKTLIEKSNNPLIQDKITSIVLTEKGKKYVEDRL